MASSDARPLPLKNVAYRVTFPILDNTGALVPGAAGLDSEISKDGGTFTDCTNEATQIATSSGMYLLDLTSTEMNADTVAIIVKTSTTDAKTTPIVLYPQEADDLKVSVTHWDGTAVASAVILAAANIASNAFTAAKFASGAFDAVWSVAARLLTASTNIEAGIADAVWDEVVDGSTTGRQSIRLANTVNGGKASGMNTTTAVMRDLADTKNRISATVDADGNRTAVVRDLT